MTNFGPDIVTFDGLQSTIRRLFEEQQSYIEVRFSRLTIKILPSRMRVDSARDRARRTADFILALAKEVGGLPARFTFSNGDDGYLEIGIASSDDGFGYWMPCEISSHDSFADPRDISARVCFGEAGDEVQRLNLPSIRKVRV